jgi:protein-S-isoprenylcysteine O-methyltransferase Ste14
VGIVLAVSITVLLVITAQKEESENIAFFGEQYQDYMEETRMFIPYIL